MLQTDISLNGITIQQTNTEGLITLCLSENGTNSTASKFAKGCIMVDKSTGLVYTNKGTVASPIWGDSIHTKVVSLTAAQILGMYAAPVEVIPAISGKSIYLLGFNFDLTGTATQFANGGVVNLQYKNTANGAGTTLHADIAATVVTGATGLVHTYRIPSVQSAVATADIVGQGVFISNKTAAFITGTGTATLNVRYYAI